MTPGEGRLVSPLGVLLAPLLSNIVVDSLVPIGPAACCSLAGLNMVLHNGSGLMAGATQVALLFVPVHGIAHGECAGACGRLELYGMRTPWS